MIPINIYLQIVILLVPCLWLIADQALANYYEKCVDVSHHKGVIEWKKVRNENPALWKKNQIFVAIAKASEGASFKDSKFLQNFKGMKAAGLTKRGAYHYFSGGPYSSSASAQFENFIDMLTRGGFVKGKDFIAVDVESQGNAGASKDAFTAKLVDLVKRLDDWAGGKTVVYTSNGEWTKLVNRKNDKFFGEHPLWVAYWTTGSKPRLPAPWKGWKLWQYKDNQKVNGIQGKVDLNYIQKPYP